MEKDPAKILAQIKGDIVVPGDASYPDAISRWAANAERRAKYVIFARDTDDVVLAIRFAGASKLALAVCGGGHSSSGASSVEGGVVVNLSRYINQVSVDAEKRLAYVGGGATWAAIDSEASKFGLSTVGGTVNETGVGGFVALYSMIE